MARRTVFFRVFIEPDLVFGVDRMAFVMLLLGSLTLIVVFKNPWLLAIGIGAFVALRYVFASDPLYMRVYKKYSDEGDRYEPFVRANPGRSGRRAGRGKGTLC